MVAIKKIHNAFEHAVYTKRTLREIRLLRLLQVRGVGRGWGGGRDMLSGANAPTNKLSLSELINQPTKLTN
jgi:hypothetical protein